LVLLGIEGGGLRLRMAGLPFEANSLLGGRDALCFGLPLGLICCGLLDLALVLGDRLLTHSLGLCPALGLPAIAFDALLTLLRRDLVAQPSLFGLVLRLLGLERGFRVALLGFGGIRVSRGLGVDLCLLKAAFSGEIVVSGKRASGLLRLAGELSDQAAGGLL
jgi:hypothetical protein